MRVFHVLAEPHTAWGDLATHFWHKKVIFPFV